MQAGHIGSSRWGADLWRAFATLLAVAIAVAPAWATTETKKVTAPDGRGGDVFGWEVDISGDYAISGATYANPDNLTDAGAAYVYARCNGAWELQTKLVAPDRAADDNFGWSVSIDGTTAIVGSPHDDTAAGTDTGSLYVYTRGSDSQWTLQAHLFANDAAPFDELGWDVWIRGDTIIAGAVHDDAEVGDRAGSAYVFRRTGNVWAQEAKLKASNAAALAEFGRGVGVSGDTAVVGASGWNTSNPGANRVYIFNRVGSTWTQTNILKASDSTGDDHFGIAVSIDNNTILVGAHTHDSGSVDTGGAYVYVRNGANWSLQARLLPPNILPDDEFGFCTALSGERAIIGAVNGTSNGVHTGTAFVFQRSGTSWAVSHELSSSDGRFHDEFGNTVGISGDTVFAGAVLGDTLQGTDAGSAYIYDLGLDAPKITSQYPIHGNAIADSLVTLYVLDTPCGERILFTNARTDANGEFTTPAYLAPYVGKYLTAVATAPDTRVSHSSTPILIESPCAIPLIPEMPVPIDGATVTAPFIDLTWSSQDAVLGGNPEWESNVSCGPFLDFNGLFPGAGNQILDWPGLDFLDQGVSFSTAEDAKLKLNHYASTLTTLSSYSDSSTDPKPIFIEFTRPMNCVSFRLDRAGSAPWTAIAYDGSGAVIAQRTESDSLPDRIGMTTPGIRTVSFIASVHTTIHDIMFFSVDCPITYDVYFGTAAFSLTKIATGLTVPQVTSPALALGTTYYWAVVANGPKGFTNGPIWSFTRSPQTVARDDAYAFPQDTGPHVLYVLDNDTSPNPLSIVSFTQPSVGLLVKNADNTFSYTPPAGFVGTTQFTYTIATTGPEDIGTAIVTLAAIHVNHAPVVVHPLPDITVSVNSGSQGINASLVFSDPDGDTLTYSVSQNTNPSIVTVTPSGAGYVIAYTPGATGTSTVSLRATDPGGLFAEDTIVVTIGAPPQPPQVTQQPAALTVNFGDTATFTCAATSQTLLNYRWQKNNVDLNDNAKFSGVTTTQLSIAACRNLEEGNYRCRISDGTATVYTNAATLTVRDPIIVSQPADTVGGVGGSALFEVVVAGSTPITYQWYIGATALPEGLKYSGVTTSRLIVHSLIDLPQNSDEQLYHCVITGVDPQPITTRSALLTVGDPAITLQPESQTVREGTNVAFSIVAVGTEPILYRWKKNGLPLSDGGRYSGTRTPTLTITGALDADEGDFVCTAVGQEIATSDAASLTVTHVPSITGIRITPANGFVPRNTTFTIEVLLDSPPDGLGFEWRHVNVLVTNGARTLGAGTPVLTISGALDADAGDYQCIVTDGVDVRTSPLAHIIVGLAFTTDLLDAFAEVGQHFEWRVRTAGNTGPVTYSWFRDAPAKALQALHDGPRFAGTGSDTLIIDPIALADDGNYLVYAQDSAETVGSRAATLHVSAEVPLTGILGLAGFAAALALVGARAQRHAQGKV